MPGQNLEARAVLWDMDGTLLDSAEYHWLTWQETFGREGLALTRDQFAATFGRRNDAVIRGFLGPDVTDVDVARIGDAKEARYRALIREGGIGPLPGVRGWLARLHAAGWRQAVASSAPRLNIEAVLAALDLARYFAADVAAEDVQRGKPDPQVYLAAAAKLGVSPARCVVVEDAAAGIEGARRAGMHSVGVGPGRASLPADLTVASLEDLPVDAFDRLLADTRRSSANA